MSSTTTTSTTTTTTTSFNELLSLYQDVFGRTAPLVHQRQMRYYANLLSPDVIVEILCETADAPAPSWRYAVKICANCEIDNVRCIYDYLARRKAFRMR